MSRNMGPKLTADESDLKAKLRGQNTVAESTVA